MKPRTILFGRHPAGLGSMATESLSSFLGRLCVARSLTAVEVLDCLVRPHVGPGVVPPRRRLSYFLSGSAIEFDGMGPLALEMVRALEHLTGRRGLSCHSFLPWDGLFAAHCSGALVRGGKRWCPLCFASQHEAGLELWEPLLWRLAPATRCPRHYIRFFDLCPHCGCTQRVLSQAVPPGLCERCARPLWDQPLTERDGKSEVESGAGPQWEWWTSFALGRMVAAQHEARESVDPAGFSTLLEDSRETVGRGSMDRLARHLGVQRKTVRAWRDREMPVRLGTFLAVCLRLGSDPLEVAFGPYAPLFDHPWSRAGFCEAPWSELRSVGEEPRKDRPGPGRASRMEEELDRALSPPTPRSASSVARSLGVCPRTVQRAFPEKYHELVAEYASFKDRERTARVARRHRAIREAVDELVAEGVVPSKTRALERARVYRRAHDRPDLVAVWRDAVDERGLVIS